MHPYGSYIHYVNGIQRRQGDSNTYANIKVNAGETVVVSVKSQNNDNLFSDMAKVYIYAPSAGEFIHLSLIMIMTHCI